MSEEGARPPGAPRSASSRRWRSRSLLCPSTTTPTSARIMVLATFAVGYNIAFGYTGLLSLGHAMFFAAGLYGAGMTAHFLHFPPPAAFAVGVMAASRSPSSSA